MEIEEGPGEPSEEEANVEEDNPSKPSDKKLKKKKIYKHAKRGGSKSEKLPLADLIQNSSPEISNEKIEPSQPHDPIITLWYVD